MRDLPMQYVIGGVRVVAEAPTMRCVSTPPRPAPRAAERRSLTPSTLRLSDVARFDAVRERLCLALRVANTLGDLRAHVAVLATEIEELVDEETAPDTVRPPSTDPAPWEGAAAPSVPADSKIGREYGV